MKQTAVEWLLEQLTPSISLQQKHIDELKEKAKEMEINQHNETWDVAHQAGRFEGKGIAEKDWQTFETYWEETFKSE
jgi:hypothetical protein